MAEGRIRRKLAITAGVVALLGGGGWLWARQWHPATAEYPLQGVEISAADGAVDWPALRAAGADFAYLDATRGTMRDPAFAGHWDASAAAGVSRGAMHRWSLCADGDSQTTAMLSTVPRDEQALPGAVALAFNADCARRPARDALIAELHAFIAAEEAHSGKPVLIQLTRAVEDHYQLAAAIDRPIWVIGAFRTPAYGGRPWAMWRANEGRGVAGLEAPVRWNVVRP